MFPPGHVIGWVTMRKMNERERESDRLIQKRKSRAVRKSETEGNPGFQGLRKWVNYGMPHLFLLRDC